MFQTKDTRGKAKQWSVVIPRVNDNQISNLKNLANDEFPYVTFAICTDDTGNSFIQAYIRAASRRRSGPIKTAVGPAIVTMCPNYTDLIMEIQMNDIFYESGVAPPALRNLEDKIARFKADVNSHCLTVPELMRKHRDICTQHIFKAIKYIKSHPLVDRKNSDSNVDVDVVEEWYRNRN